MKDPTKVTTTDGKPARPGYEDMPAPAPKKANGQHEAYWILTEAERKRGFVRPLRISYTHEVCGATTTMALELAETYARDPKFYGATFCWKCREHFPVGQFWWADTSERVGS